MTDKELAFAIWFLTTFRREFDKYNESRRW